MIDEIKKTLRVRASELNAALDDKYIAESNIGIYNNVINLPEFKSAKCVFAYYSVGDEPSTAEIIKAALEMGKTVALPRIVGGGIMNAVAIRSESELVSGKFNIPAPPEDAPIVSPDAIDFIIVPAVLFDDACYRLGRGGGYYDRYLAKCSAFSVGLTRQVLLQNEVPRGEYDMPVCAVITEKKIARPR